MSFALLVSTVLLVSLTLDGHGQQFLWPNWTFWSNQGLILSLALFVIAIENYTLRVLEVKEHFPGWALASTILVGSLLILILIRMSDIVNQDLLARPAAVLLVSVFIMPIALALRMHRIRPRQARIVVVSFAVLFLFILSTSVSLALGLGVPDSNTVFRGPFIWLLLVYTFAANDRIREMREQREQVQRELLTEQRKSLQVKTELIRELERKNIELEHFTYTVSYDLRSPLVTIRGFLGYLEKSAGEGNMERFRKDLNRISSATARMDALLQGLLELSRIGRLTNGPQEIPFEDLVREASELVHGQLEKSGVSIHLHPNLPVVYGDRPRLTEVLLNLLDNAAKYMGGRPEPKIEIGRNGEENGRPIFFVRDNGLGIAPEYHERIFGLFNKLNPEAEGTGIGLALVKRIVEFHGGRIWVESETGKGSTFYFTLPTR